MLIFSSIFSVFITNVFIYGKFFTRSLGGCIYGILTWPALASHIWNRINLYIIDNQITGILIVIRNLDPPAVQSGCQIQVIHFFGNLFVFFIRIRNIHFYCDVLTITGQILNFRSLCFA